MHSLLQTAFWAGFKSHQGWQPHQISNLFFLERKFPLGQRFIYAPELPVETPHGFTQIVSAATQLGRDYHAFVVRLEFLANWSDSLAAQLQALGLRKAFEEVQPEFRQWIDVTPSPEEILGQMKPKGRYNIRLAQKHGLTITIEQSTDVFYQLFRETAQRDGFAIRSPGYFADLLAMLHKHGAGELLLVSKGDQPLAAAIISYYAGHAMYLYGASSALNREAMAPYLLHWHAIERAKEHNCTTYDLLAIAPFEEIRNAQFLPAGEAGVMRNSEKYAGITRFKRQFGGRPVRLLGSWDIVIRPTIYQLFKIAESFRRS